MTSDSDVEMANWRRRNGREEPWILSLLVLVTKAGVAVVI